MKHISYIFIFMLCLISALTAQQQEPKGTIRGKVTSAETKEPLIGTTVLVINTKLGATTDSEGNFIIQNVPVGGCSLEFRSIGYSNYIRTDVQVRPGRITTADAGLKEAVIQTDQITVSSGYFQSTDVNNIGLVNFNSEEIKRSPGSMGDVSRILMAMPSAAKVSDDNNDLVVRGGSPGENGFFVDGIPVPNINHFPNIGSTGGPIGILNVDFIDNFNFLTSGFSSSYGDRLSSIIDIRFREGNKDEIDLQADLNWAGFGGAAEGPMPGKKGSWLAAFKRSYLDFFSKAAGWGMIIRYGDAQAKVSFDINKNHKIALLDIFADDHERFGREDALEQGSSYYGTINNYQNTAGLSWRALWSRDAYSVTGLSFSVQSFKNDFDKVSTAEKYLVSHNVEKLFSLRNISYFQLSKLNKLEGGFDLSSETGDYNYIKYPAINRLGIAEPAFVLSRGIKPRRAGAFLTFISSPAEKLTASLGIRADYYSINKTTLLSPRISISYALTDRLKLSANSGIFYQRLPLFILSQKPGFESLSEITAYHFGGGMEYMLSSDTRVTFEIYDKEYDKLPLSKDDPSLSVIDGGLTGNAFGNFGSIESVGRGYTRGAELLIQKKLSDDIYGIISSSYFRSRYRDYAGVWRDRIYDNKFIFSFIGGYKPSRDWEFSLRWTYAGGCPYTPLNFEKSLEAAAGVIDSDRINGERYPDYHSLNLRIDKKFFFSSQSLDIYLSVWNSYNRKNVSDYYWNAENNRIDTIYQWSILPIFGIEYEI